MTWRGSVVVIKKYRRTSCTLYRKDDVSVDTVVPSLVERDES